MKGIPCSVVFINFVISEYKKLPKMYAGIGFQCSSEGMLPFTCEYEGNSKQFFENNIFAIACIFKERGLLLDEDETVMNLRLFLSPKINVPKEAGTKYRNFKSKYLLNRKPFQILIELAWGLLFHEWYKDKVAIKTFNFYSKLEDELSKKSKEGAFFRGDSHYGYGLIPTCFRGCEERQHINKELVEKQLEGIGIRERYNEVYAQQSSDEEYWSFVQHTISFSPMLDVTRKWEIALSFALNQHISPQVFYKSKPKVTCFMGLDNVKNGDFNYDDFEVSIYKKMDLSRFIVSKKCGTFEDIRRYLTPEFTLVTDQSSDRMAYQHGALLFLKKGIIIDGFLPWFLDERLHIFECRFPGDYSGDIAKRKRKLLDALLKKHPHYSYSNLMDPYKFVGGR